MDPPPYDDKLPPPPYPGLDVQHKYVDAHNPPPSSWQQQPGCGMARSTTTVSSCRPPVSVAQLQQPQRHINLVVVDGDGLNQASFVGEPLLVESYLRHVVLACTVMWCCSCPFGLVAYILASMAQSAAVLDRARARRLARASLKVSFIGIILTVVVGAIVGGVCRSHGICVSRWHKMSPPSSLTNCSKIELRGVCYSERRKVSYPDLINCNRQRTFEACCLPHEDVYDNKYCYTLDTEQRGVVFNNRIQQQQLPTTSNNDLPMGTGPVRAIVPTEEIPAVYSPVAVHSVP